MDRREFLALCGASAAVAGCTAARENTNTDTETGAGVATTVDGDWSGYRRDAGNTGATDAPGPVDRPAEVWTHSTAAGVPAAPPAVADGAFAVVTESGTVYVRNADDGRVRWSRAAGGAPSGGPVVVAGSVVVATDEGLVAFGLESGSQRWERPVDAAVTGLARVGERVVAAAESALFAVGSEGSERWRRPVDGRVVTPPGGGRRGVAVGLSAGDLLAVDRDGSDRWRRAVPGDPAFAPTVADGRVLHAAHTHVVALDAATGDRRWDRRTSFPVAASPAWTPDRAYVGTLDTDAERTPEDTPLPTDVYGFVAGLVALTPDGRERWRTTERGTYNFTSGPPTGLPLAATGDRVFFAPTGSLVAYDAASGARLWSAPAEGVTPAVADGVVSTGRVGVAAGTGTVTWRFRGSGGIAAQPAVVGNTAYVGSDDHAVYALAADTGTVEWTARTDAPVRATPTVGDDAVYVGDVRGTLYAFDRDDGAERWRTNVGEEVHAPAGLGGVLFVGTFSRSLHAVDAADGTVLWQTEVQSDRFVSLTPAAADGRVYAGANGDLRVFAADDGTEQWRVTYGQGPQVQSPPVVRDGRVLVNAGDSLRALDAADGTEHWSARTGGSSRPPVVRDGRIYAPGDGTLYAFAADGAERRRTNVGEDLMLAAGDGAVYGVGVETPPTAFDPSDGRERWRYDRSATTGPAVAGAHLFVGDERGTVRAFGPERG